MATGMFENDASGNCLQQQQPPPGVPDSPDSIPLPDSPPPESDERIGVGVLGHPEEADTDEVPDDPTEPIDNLGTNNNNNSLGVVNNMPQHNSSTSSGTTRGPIVATGAAKRKCGRKPRLAEEYDPSEPLTSSDEEEHSLQLIEEVVVSKRNTRPNETNRNSGGGGGANSVLESSRLTSPPRPIRLSTTPPPISSTPTISKTLTLPAVTNISNKVAEQTPVFTNSSSTTTIRTSSNSNLSNTPVELSSIPVPPEENRRPVIHFSIPTRHRLLPISSLLKRQQKRAGGVGVGGTGANQADGLKGSSEKNQDGEEDEEDDDVEDSNRPKISLVAEIFGGTDDEDEENEDETEAATQQQPGKQQPQAEDGDNVNAENTLVNQNNSLFDNEQNSQAIDPTANSGRWKLVADQPSEIPNGESGTVLGPPPLQQPSLEKTSDHITPSASASTNVPPSTEQSVDNAAGEDEPEIIEIVTLNVPPTSRLRPLRRRPFFGRVENGGEPEVIDIDKDDDDEVVVAPPPTTVVAPPVAEFSAPLAPPTPEERAPRTLSLSPPRRISSALLDISTNSENNDKIDKEKEKRHSRASPAAATTATTVESSPSRPERHFKRPHSSSSMSNCEEGEIVDSVSKKRKKDKKKKTKRRKRSKDSLSPLHNSSSSSSKLPEKRLSDSIPPPASTSDHDENDERGGGGAISWRKPSKRTQNRNYRDGKPKADDTFFREKEIEEKQKSSSPAHRRTKPTGRKERSPLKEKSSRHRRDGSPRNRSHSRSPATRRASRSRSKSSARPYRSSRRRNRHSRSKSSDSISDKSRSGRSSSRRRSRKRHRRSTSRHHAGDSRSPSYITEPIRSRSSHYSKFRDRSRTRSRDKQHVRGRHRNKRSVTRSRTPSPRGHKKNRKPESSLERQHRKKQLKEKEKAHHHQPHHHQVEEALSDSKEKRKEKEKLKDKEKKKRKEKEKPKEEEKAKPPKEKPKEKEKKKKKKRREKSPTPVKAIVADGDSIVVSLSFQKGKSSSGSSSNQNNVPSSASTEDRKENGLDTSTNSESSSPSKPSKQLSPTKQSGASSGKDAAESINENKETQRTQSSPAKLSSVTDEEGSTTPPLATAPATKSLLLSKPEEKETEAAKVTSSGAGSSGSHSPFEAERAFNSAPADSTKTTTPQPSETQDSSQNHSVRSSSLSPNTDVESGAQGDTLVTSTGDSIDPTTAHHHGTEDEAKSNTSSTPSTKQPQQQSETNKVKATGTSVSPRVGQGASTAENSSGASASATTSTSTSTTVNSGSSTSSASNSSSQSSVTLTMTRPLIGNIPGLYPSNAIITGGGSGPVPPPIVIPTPPPPRQILYSNAGQAAAAAPMLNPNVLASVASALLAVRQNQAQPTYPGAGKQVTPANSGGSGGGDNTGNSTQLRTFNVLGTNAKNFNALQANYRAVMANNNNSYNQSQELGGGGGGGGGGESPMSPNSSDGDDLFEPPIDRQSEGGKMGKNGQLFGNMPMLPNSANDSFNSAPGSGTKNNDNRNSLFDTLFGGSGGGQSNNVSGPKKSAANKPEKMGKNKVKHRKGGPKKEIIKVNTSGGLTEGELRLTDEVPTSAVELIVKQKYLKKLNRQERVVEEVKVALKPYYSKRQVNKDEYKEILRRAVPKICHNKTGEINPGKIKELVEAYVKKFRHARKRGLDLSSVK